MTETYYTVLGVPRSATATEIKAAYRELMRQVHPDAVPNASPYWRKLAEEKAKEINEAYQVLSDSAKRRQYDQLLDAYQQAHAQPSQATHSPHSNPGGTSKRSQQTQARPGAWYHRPGTSQQGQHQSSATGQGSRNRPAWGVLCLIWAFGATAAAKQTRYVMAVICLLLCTLVALRGGVAERIQRKQAQERRLVWVLDQSGNCFPIEKHELRRRAGLRQISVTDPSCVI